MVKEPVRLRFSSVKAVVRSAMGNYQIHGAKIGFHFGIRKWDFGFFKLYKTWLCEYHNSEIEIPNSEIIIPLPIQIKPACL